MASLNLLPDHVQIALKAISYCLKKFDPQEWPQEVKDLQTAREFLLGSVGLREKLYDLNAHILALEKEVAVLQSTEDRLKTNWEALRDIEIEQAYESGVTTMDIAKGRGKRDPKVVKALDAYFQKRQERKDKETEVRYAVRRWNDLHAQEKRAYGVQIREAIAPQEDFGDKP